VGLQREPADVSAGDLDAPAVKRAKLRLHFVVKWGDHGAH
jgi:hypothetical protein